MRILAAFLSFLSLSAVVQAAPVSFGPSNGTVEWKGEMVAGETHKGTITLKKGSLDLAAKKGEFLIDMNTVKPVGMAEDRARKLKQHLESPDFFDALAFPEAKIVIKDLAKTGKDEYLVTSDVTIRGTTNEEKFPAKIVTAGKRLKIDTTFSFDRSRYKQSYQLEPDASAVEKAKELAKQTVNAAKQSIIKNQIELVIHLESQ